MIRVCSRERFVATAPCWNSLAVYNWTLSDSVCHNAVASKTEFARQGTLSTSSLPLYKHHSLLSASYHAFSIASGREDAPTAAILTLESEVHAPMYFRPPEENLRRLSFCNHLGRSVFLSRQGENFRGAFSLPHWRAIGSRANTVTAERSELVTLQK